MINETLWPSANAPLPPISDEELDYLFMVDREKIMWRDNQPKYSFRDQIDHFKPEAIKPARKGLKDQLKFYKKRLREINNQQEKYYEERIINIPWQERNDFEEDSNKDFDVIRKRIESKIKRIMFNLSYLDELEGKADKKETKGVTEADIARAKEIPITSFIEVGRSGFTKCPFHPETNASFKYYANQNSWWCYSCASGGSVIDLVMKQQNIDFLSAVKFLLK